MAYLPFGPLQSLTYGNGLSQTRTYDQNYWLSQTQVAATGVTRLDLSFGITVTLYEIRPRCCCFVLATLTHFR